MRLPSYAEPETLDVSVSEQLEAIRKLLHPSLTKKDMARVKRHPAVRTAIKEEDYLILAWSDGSVTFHESVGEAIRTIRPDLCIQNQGA